MTFTSKIFVSHLKCRGTIEHSTSAPALEPFHHNIKCTKKLAFIIQINKKHRYSKNECFVFLFILI